MFATFSSEWERGRGCNAVLSSGDANKSYLLLETTSDTPPPFRYSTFGICWKIFHVGLPLVHHTGPFHKDCKCVQHRGRPARIHPWVFTCTRLDSLVEHKVHSFVCVV